MTPTTNNIVCRDVNGQPLAKGQRVCIDGQPERAGTVIRLCKRGTAFVKFDKPFDGRHDTLSCIATSLACLDMMVTAQQPVKDVHCPRFGRCKATTRCPLPDHTVINGTKMAPVIPEGAHCARYPTKATEFNCPHDGAQCRLTAQDRQVIPNYCHRAPEGWCLESGQ
jgi:hypothetical protein